MTRTGVSPNPVGLGEIVGPLATMTERTARLVETLDRPDAPAIGVWSALETSVHVTQAVEVDLGVATGTLDGDFRRRLDEVSFATLDQVTQALVRDEPERDPKALAARLRAAGEALAECLRVAPDNEPVRWLGPAALPLSAVGGHAVEEMLVHGLDIARSQRRPWPMEADVLRATVGGFVLPMMYAVDAGEFVDASRIRGFTAAFEVRVRGVDRVFFVIDDGRVRIVPDWDGPVDARVSAEPGAFLLTHLGRSGRVGPVLTGRMVAWGRRPWRLRRFLGAMRSV